MLFLNIHDLTFSNLCGNHKDLLDVCPAKLSSQFLRHQRQ